MKKSVSLLPWLLILVILQPLCLLRNTKIPLFFAGLPCIVYLEKSIRWRFLRVSSFDSHMWESIIILISLFRLKNVLSFADSFCVPVFEPLRFVEVIIILLADFGLNGFILTIMCWVLRSLSIVCKGEAWYG